MITVAELLERWLVADHPWKPSTQVGYASNARLILADRKLASTRVISLTPQAVRAAFGRWEAAGATRSTVALRFRVLRSAIGWAYDERIIDHHPIRSMRGPGRPEPRRPLADDEIRVLLAFAEQRVLEAVANDRDLRHRQLAEQDLLMVRLAADSGARRGELVALRFDDLAGQVLHVRRAASADVITTPKSGRTRTLTLGSSTARLWRTLEQDWGRDSDAALGPWVFSPETTHSRRLTNAALGHRFERLRDAAGVPGASLHRLRHTVATFLVARGEILQAQARLGHADASTTLREYAYALPLTDQSVADAIDRHLDELTSPVAPDPPARSTQ
jgi:integrase